MLALSKAGYRVLRINAGSFGVEDRRVKAAPPGFPDLLVYLPRGRVIHMEVKSATGKLAASQENFRAMCFDLQHTYVVVRSVADALAACATAQRA